MKHAKVDFLIVGAGIAGLWLLADLKARGYSVLLCESNAIGSGQTLASQGIIHGGTKYALTGKASKASMTIADMPNRWKQALAGKGRVKLQDVKCLSQHQLLWTSPNIASKVTGFFASKVMKSRMQLVDSKNYPELFQHPDFKGNLYQLDEPVLDIPSLLQSFHRQFSDFIIQSDAANSSLVNIDNNWAFETALQDNASLQIQAQQIILCAGEGNEALSKPLGIKAPTMQRRPLRMLMAKAKHLPMIYAHALGVSDKPKMTITSHKANDRETVWYIGGEPAEKGASKSEEVTIESTKKELQNLLPWIDGSTLQWSSFTINRAEGIQDNGKRPDLPFIQQVDNVSVAWPTKLAFAPMLADEITHHFTKLKPISDPHIPQNLELANIGNAHWSNY